MSHCSFRSSLGGIKMDVKGHGIEIALLIALFYPYLEQLCCEKAKSRGAPCT